MMALPNARQQSRGYSDNKIIGSEVDTMKIIVLGKANIGKTSLTKRFVHNEFSSVESTV